MSSLVSEIVIAGRNLERTQKCAKDIGGKARAIPVDVADRGKLIALARDFDIVVNTTGPEYETVLGVLNAAIMAGTNYCDIGADGPTTKAALELDSTRLDGKSQRGHPTVSWIPRRGFGRRQK